MSARDRRRGGAAKLALLAACLAAVPSGPAGAQVYRWVDEDGRVHFGDRPPETAGRDATDLSSRYRPERFFDVRIVPHRYRMGLDVKDKITVAVSKIFDIYFADLGLANPEHADLEIHIYGDEAEFRALTRSVGLAIENASGFYATRDRAVHVWKNRNAGRLLRVLTHEASHAIMGYHARRVPAWLNEGLAEYFETMRVAGQAIVIPRNPRAVRVAARLVETGAVPPLAEYLTLANRDWYRRNGDDGASYALGWSMVFFAMSSAPGRATLRALLGHYATEPKATNRDAVEGIETSYPGGVAGFERAWRAFAILAPFEPPRPHRY